MDAGRHVRPAFSVPYCAKIVEKICLTVRYILRRMSHIIAFLEVLGVPANNEQNSF